MKTKREVLEIIVKDKGCSLSCYDCPYLKHNTGIEDSCILRQLNTIGAMAILRQNRKKRGFDPSKILTSVTAEQAKVGMRGYFADSLYDLQYEYAQKNIHILTKICDIEFCTRFKADNQFAWALFYPIEEVKE